MGSLVFYLAAAAVIVTTTAAVVTAVIAAAQRAAAVAEQQNQDNDPPAVVAAKAIVTHKNTSQDFFRVIPLIPRYSPRLNWCSRQTKMPLTNDQRHMYHFALAGMRLLQVSPLG